MIEIPEANTLARQMNDVLQGLVIVDAVAASSPHGFAWYFGDPSSYPPTLTGKTITGASAHGGRPEIVAQDMRICFGDGVNVRYFTPGVKLPAKHLFGHPGGYHVVLSRLTDNTPCPRCGDTIKRASYMGGNVYYCETCQPQK